ncbi:hypothetical protein C8Q78DRAFT_1077400 [Trametes maxima]|nr:hypothetical protein C8Q78DRAFT_1077400 [Trametes maxima]
MNRPRLNADTLLCILPFVEKSTICALLQTCHFLHHEGAKYLLDEEILIDIARGYLDSFILFMLADGLHRVRFLRRLALWSFTAGQPIEPQRTMSSSTGRALAQLFRHIAERGNLRSLGLPAEAEALLSSTEELPLAIAALPKLRYFSVHQAGPRGRWLLKNLKSELVDANISLLENGNPPNGEGVQTVQEEGGQFGHLEGDAVQLCVHSRRSLRKISIWADRTIGHLRSSPKPQDIPVYARLTDLSLSIDEFGGKLIGYLSRAFPNLAHLTTHGYGGARLDKYRESRERNKQDQKELGRWTSLRCYKTTVATLYALGIECQVQCVHLTHFNVDFHAAMLRAGLEDVRPSQLALRFTGARWLFHNDFHAIFTGPGGQGLKTLKLDVMLDEEDLRIHPIRIIEAVIQKVIMPLRSLVTLQFSMNVECFTEEHDSPDFGQFKQIIDGLVADKIADIMRRASAAASGSLANIWVELYVGDDEDLTREAFIGLPMDDPFWDDWECPA